MAMRGNNVKTVVFILLVVSLVAVEQTRKAEAYLCCVINNKVTLYLGCRIFGGIKTCCDKLGYYAHLDDYGCQDPYVNGYLFGMQAGDRNTAIDYCKLGCTSSMCNKITSSAIGGSENGKDAIERCTNACHDLCTENNTEIAKIQDA